MINLIHQVMDTHMLITQAYRKICEAVNKKLVSHGYQVVHEQHDDKVFDSRYIIWSNNEDALRFTWDGKEGWFILEVTDTLPLSVITAWDEIIVSPYHPSRNDEAYVNTICSQIVHSLE